MSIALNGVKFGLVLAFLIGPVFFAIIQTSIEKGFWKGVIVALGVSASDILCVLISYFGLAQLITEPRFRIQLAYVGGIILLGFGLYYLLIKGRKKLATGREMDTNKPHYRYFLKGFVINGFSPSVLMFWIGTLSLVSIDFGYTRGSEFFIFFVALLCTVLITDIVKAYLAGKLGRLITPGVLRFLNLGLGLVLFGFGLRLIFYANAF